MAKSKTPEDSPDPYMQQILTRFEQAAKARVETALATLKAETIPRLKKWGVAKVHVEYSGYGDSGSINCIEYFDAHDKPVNMDMVRAASDPEIEGILYKFLPDGFEINDGGQGDVYIDVAAGTVKLEHQENVTETRDSTKQWEV